MVEVEIANYPHQFADAEALIKRNHRIGRQNIHNGIGERSTDRLGEQIVYEHFGPNGNRDDV